jgi:uncharacterized protein (DUF2164 family)
MRVVYGRGQSIRFSRHALTMFGGARFVGGGLLLTSEFSKEEQTRLVGLVQSHFKKEFDLELGRFEAEGVAEFFSKVLGPQFYNRGLHDAQALLAKQIDLFNDAVYQLERTPEK